MATFGDSGPDLGPGPDDDPRELRTLRPGAASSASRDAPTVGPITGTTLDTGGDTPSIAGSGTEPPADPDSTADAPITGPGSAIDRFGPPPGILSPDEMKSLTGELGGIEWRRGAEMARTNSLYGSRVEADERMMRDAWRAEQAAKNNIPPPWNADRERDARIRGPLESFASIGTIFGLIASSFTRAPLTSALNAGAAAMNAIHEHDEKGYEAAYNAWKENTNLALKRFDMERQTFQDTNTLLTTDMSLWRARTLADAAKYDNQKVITLLNHGMDSAVLDLQAKQIKAAEDMMKASTDFDTFNAQRSLLPSMFAAWDAKHPEAAGPNATPQQQMERIMARKEILDSLKSGGENQWQIRTFNSWLLGKLANGEVPTPEEKLDFISRMHTYGGRAGSLSDQEFISKFREENPDATADEFSAAYSKFKRDQKAQGTGTGIVTPTRLDAGERARRTVEYIDAGMTPKDAFDRAAREVKEDSAVPTPSRDIAAGSRALRDTLKQQGLPDAEVDRQVDAYINRRKIGQVVISGNRRDDIASLITRAGTFENTIDKIEELLYKHKALTGIGGRATRPLEVVSNWFGVHETDRAQFKSYIDELRDWGTQVLNETRAGRQLAAQEGRMASIIPGLNAGDTTINTQDRLMELKKLVGTLRKQLTDRYHGTWSPDTAPGGTSVPVPSSRTGGSWDDVPDGPAFGTATPPTVPRSPTAPASAR
jgi:hypothetical protein